MMNRKPMTVRITTEIRRWMNQAITAKMAIRMRGWGSCNKYNNPSMSHCMIAASVSKKPPILFVSQSTTDFAVGPTGIL
ncbi:hypothetical protein D9M72_580430 [compost metagenome]